MLRRMLMVSLATIGLLSLSSLASAQATPGPTAEHQSLAKFVGDWDCEITMIGSAKSQGAATYRMELNGLHLVQSFKADFGGLPFEGRGTSSYCPLRKKLISTWIDTMMPSPTLMEGVIEEKGKRLVETGEGPGEQGLMKMKNVTEWKDDNTFQFTMYELKGAEAKEMMAITYKRKK